MTYRELDQYLRQSDEPAFPDLTVPSAVPSATDSVLTMYYAEPTPLFVPPSNGYNITRFYMEDSTPARKCIKISKHAPQPTRMHPHKHDFIEMNYMYAGRCTNVVNGQDLAMEEGDLLIMDNQTVHCPKQMEPENVLINIIMLPQYLESAIEYALPGSSEITSFFINCLHGLNKQPNYMFFSLKDHLSLKMVFQALIKEYYSPDSLHSELLLSSYTHSMLLLLDRVLVEYPSQVRMAYTPNSKAAQIVSYIKSNCANCSLEDIAQHFQYSTNYIQKLLKRHIGLSFLELRNAFRLDQIHYSLHTTDLPVRALAERFGFYNITYFYQLYKKRYGRLPRSQKTD